MTGKGTKTPLCALLEGLIGIILVLFALVLLRYAADNTSWPVFDGFVGVLSAQAPLIVIFLVLFMIGEVLAAFPFPLNLPFPVFNAVGSVFVVTLILKILEFLDRFYALGIAGALAVIGLILLPLTLLVTLAAGYISIFAPPCQGERSGRDTTGPVDSGKVEPECPSWEEIGEEFRKACSDFVRKMREEMRGD